VYDYWNGEKVRWIFEALILFLISLTAAVGTCL